MYPIHRRLADNEGKRARAGGHDGGMRAKARRARDTASVQYNNESRATRELGSEGTRFQHVVLDANYPRKPLAKSYTSQYVGPLDDHDV